MIEDSLGIDHDLVVPIVYGKTFHTIWLGGKPDASRIEAISTIFNKAKNMDDVIITIWTKNRDAKEELLSALPEVIKNKARIRFIFDEVIDLNKPEDQWKRDYYQFFERAKIFASITDLVRWLILLKEGGHYMDFSVKLPPNDDSFLTNTHYKAKFLVGSDSALNDVGFHFINSDRFSVPRANHELVKRILDKIRQNFEKVKRSRFLQQVMLEDGPLRRHLIIRYNVVPIIHSLFELTYGREIDEDELIERFLQKNYYNARISAFKIFGVDLHILTKIIARELKGSSWTTYDNYNSLTNMRGLMLSRHIAWAQKNKLSDLADNLKHYADYGSTLKDRVIDHDIIKIFLDLDKQGLVPFDDKSLFPVNNMLEIFKQPNPLFDEAAHNRHQMIESIVKDLPEAKNFKSYLKNRFGETPLHIAAQNGYWEFVTELEKHIPHLFQDPYLIYKNSGDPALFDSYQYDKVFQILKKYPSQLLGRDNRDVLNYVFKKGDSPVELAKKLPKIITAVSIANNPKLKTILQEQIVNPEYVEISVSDIINHAKTLPSNYNLKYLQTDEGKMRLRLALAMLSVGIIPDPLKKSHSVEFFKHTTSKYALSAIADMVSESNGKGLEYFSQEFVRREN